MSGLSRPPGVAVNPYGREKGSLSESTGEAQESYLMSVNQDISRVEVEGVKEEVSRDGCSHLNDFGRDSAVVDISMNTTGSKESSNAHGGEESGSNCGDVTPQIFPSTSGVSQEDISLHATITSSDLAAAAKEEVLPQRKQDSNMTSTSALCKYRWAKVVSTDSVDVGFYPSYAPVSSILEFRNANGTDWLHHRIKVCEREKEKEREREGRRRREIIPSYHENSK